MHPCSSTSAFTSTTHKSKNRPIYLYTKTHTAAKKTTRLVRNTTRRTPSVSRGARTHCSESVVAHSRLHTHTHTRIRKCTHAREPRDAASARDETITDGRDDVPEPSRRVDVVASKCAVQDCGGCGDWRRAQAPTATGMQPRRSYLAHSRIQIHIHTHTYVHTAAAAAESRTCYCCCCETAATNNTRAHHAYTCTMHDTASAR